jgi:hypothetical protein
MAHNAAHVGFLLIGNPPPTTNIPELRTHCASFCRCGA